MPFKTSTNHDSSSHAIYPFPPLNSYITLAPLTRQSGINYLHAVHSIECRKKLLPSRNRLKNVCDFSQVINTAPTLEICAKVYDWLWRVVTVHCIVIRAPRYITRSARRPRRFLIRIICAGPFLFDQSKHSAPRFCSTAKKILQAAQYYSDS